MKREDLFKSEVMVVCVDCGEKFSEGELILVEVKDDEGIYYDEHCPYCNGVSILDLSEEEEEELP